MKSLNKNLELNQEKSLKTKISESSKPCLESGCKSKSTLQFQEINENSKSLITVEDFNFEKDENVFSKNSAERKNDNVSNIPFSQSSFGYSDK